MATQRHKREKIPHDQIFKVAFTNFLGDLIEILDPKLAELLDLSQLKFLDKESFTDLPGGRRADLDLVAETRTRLGEPRAVLLHLENEGRYRRATEQRLLAYSMHLKLKHGHPVITIVVYLRGGPPGIAWQELVEKVGSFEILRFRYLAFGVAGSSAERFLELPQPLAPALAALMRPSTMARPEQKLQCMKRISAAPLDDAQRFLLTTVVNTYLELKGEEAQRYAVELEKKANQEVRKMVITWEEAQQSETRGQLKALRQMLEVLLVKRFGIRFEDVKDRVLTIEDPKRLEKILEKAIDARSLEELGLTT